MQRKMKEMNRNYKSLEDNLIKRSDNQNMEGCLLDQENLIK